MNPDTKIRQSGANLAPTHCAWGGGTALKRYSRDMVSSMLFTDSEKSISKQCKVVQSMLMALRISLCWTLLLEWTFFPITEMANWKYKTFFLSIRYPSFTDAVPVIWTTRCAWRSCFLACPIRGTCRKRRWRNCVVVWPAEFMLYVIESRSLRKVRFLSL